MFRNQWPTPKAQGLSTAHPEPTARFQAEGIKMRVKFTADDDCRGPLMYLTSSFQTLLVTEPFVRWNLTQNQNLSTRIEREWNYSVQKPLWNKRCYSVGQGRGTAKKLEGIRLYPGKEANRNGPELAQTAPEGHDQHGLCCNRRLVGWG